MCRQNKSDAVKKFSLRQLAVQMLSEESNIVETVNVETMHRPR